MKLYLPLAFLLLAVSTAAQTSVNLQTNSTTWFVTNVNFNPYLGHEYEGCWPNGTLALSTNQSGSFFTASEWTGPACEDYDLSGGETFYIDNSSQYGYLDSNDSVQFNYNIINSSMILLNLWYGCEGNQNCDTTADVILSIENPNPCIINTDLYTINICSLSSPFSGSAGFAYSYWNYSLSLLNNNVTSCDGSQNVWGTFNDFNGCHDIATQAPNYTVQNPGTPSQSSLTILFPVQQSSNSSTTFQLSLTLSCNSYATTTTLSLASVDANLESNFTTIYLTGSSPSVCPQPIGCSAVAVGGSYYNLCPLQQSNLTFFNISDQVLGELSFNLGNTPLIPNCPGQNESYVFATYTTLDGCFTLASNALTYSSSNSGGLQIVFPQAYYEFLYVTVTIQLQCDASQVSAVEFGSELSSQASFSGIASYVSSTLQGTSPYACPISTDTLNA